MLLHLLNANIQADIEGGHVKLKHAKRFQIAFPLIGAWDLEVAHSKARDASMSRCKTAVPSLAYDENLEHTKSLKFSLVYLLASSPSHLQGGV